ncbi:MAG: hypothetical protein JRN59_06075 [Nitrososphaerota archaeon]|nr:hypothetical protein [Nitrososphaerota archaeon]
MSSQQTELAKSARQATSPVEALSQALKSAGAGHVLVYAKCPVTGAHHCLGRLERVREPFHAVPLTIVYKRSRGRGRGFGIIAESPLVPTGAYLKVRELLKRYVGFATGVKGYSEFTSRCDCGSVRSPLIEKVRFGDGRARFHLSFACTSCGSVRRPWVAHYVQRFRWLVQRAKTARALKAGGLRCRRCGERALRARAKSGSDLEWGLMNNDLREIFIRCGRCGFTIVQPRFEKSPTTGEVVEVKEGEA